MDFSHQQTNKGAAAVGVSNGTESAPVFTHILRWNQFGRKGESCRVLSGNSRLVTIEFTDGEKKVVNRNAIVRSAECRDSVAKRHKTPTEREPVN